MKKRILSFALALCFVLTLLPAAFADSAPTSGKCGDNLTWRLNGSVLTISGTGDMYDYDERNDDTPPWYYYIDRITEVVIEQGVTAIGKDGFCKLFSLTSVQLPGSLKSIGSSAFHDCWKLESIKFPDGLTTVELSAFDGCSSLESFNVSAGNKTYSSENGVLFNKNRTELVMYPQGKTNTSYTVPSSVVNIGEAAFVECQNLKEVVLPEGVENIGKSAFSDCWNFENITLPKSLKTIGEEAFSGCGNLKNISLPDNLTTIGSDAFIWCGFKSITIPSSVIKIGEPFTCRNKLESISVSANNSAYSAENGVLFNKNKTKLITYPERKVGESYTVPSSVNSIAAGAFTDSTLKSVTIPNSVKSIGNAAFFCCYNLEGITIPSSVTNIGDRAFMMCNTLTDVAVPNGVSKISYATFACCSSLKSITLPSSVKSIGDSAFAGCDFESITLPSSVESIEGSAFNGCENLGSITIPSGVKSIEERTFWNCYGLESVTIPLSVKTIKSGAFDYCFGLANVYYDGTAAQWNKVVVEEDNYPLEKATIHYIEHIHSYKTTVTTPTCSEKGYTTHTCVSCGNSYKDSYTNALGHNYSTGKCTRCGAADPNYNPAPAAPALKITTSAGKPKIYWNAVDGAAKYWVYRSTDGKNFRYYDSTTKTSYTNNSTSIGTTYYYKVKAVAVVDGKNYASDYSVAKSIQCKPAAPTVSINRSNGKPKLSWKAVSGATKYWIYRSTDGVNFKYWDSTTKTSYTNSGAASGTKYYYRVKAVAVVNGKNVISANSSTKSLFTSLAKPSVSITTSNGKPKITWNAVTGADKYYIYRSTDGKNFSYWDSTTKTTYVNSGAKKNTKYYYKVKAVCASNSNANSAQSSTVSIKATK